VEDIDEQITQDITDLSEYLKNIFNFFPAPTALTTPAGIVLEFNQSFERVSGFKKEEIIGEKLSLIFGEDASKEIIEETIKKGRIEKKEYNLFLEKGKKKKILPVSVSTRLRTDEGRPAGIFLSAISLARVKKVEERLEEANIILEIRVRARTRRSREFVEKLEDMVAERTKELQKKLRDLERFHKLTQGREKRLEELKMENQSLKNKLKKLEKGLNLINKPNA